MPLSSEDLLRLNVLLANNIEAIRIDEQTMTVYGLSDESEARVPLNPDTRPEKYLRQVRELLSSHALGSPGGYPVFLQRWTRMGQARDGQLDKLLLLGEPEAVIAVAGATGLSDELARRAWWAQPTADIARRMLERQSIVDGRMGKILAIYLTEHLPFENDPLTIINSVRLVLQPGLIDTETRLRIWTKGTYKNVYHIGFLQATPADLPEPVAARFDYERHGATLGDLGQKGNTLAVFMAELLDRPGQTFLATAEKLLHHPVNDDAVAALLNTIGDYFKPARQANRESHDIQDIIMYAETQEAAVSNNLRVLMEAMPALKNEISAMITLAHTDETLIIPILARTTASGSLLRRKLESVITPLLRQCAVLRGTQIPEAISRRQRR
jgi:hypothetical protein